MPWRSLYAAIIARGTAEPPTNIPLIDERSQRAGSASSNCRMPIQIVGTPDDCIAAIEEYRDAGCTHVMLELWGDRRHDQIRLFGEKVLPHVRG